MKRKTIVIDMDEVLTGDGFVNIINEFLETNYKTSDFKNYYIQDCIPDKEKFFEYYFTKNEYEYVNIKENACEVVKELCEKYDVFVGTSYIFRDVPDKCGIILKYKYDYLIKNFPFINPNNLVFLGNKSILKSDIKIDDRIENLNDAKIKLLFTAYHNKELTDEYLNSKGIIRVNNWLDIKKILLED